MKESKVLTKTDRNGTKYWKVTESCPRCGGSGFYAHYGVCFLCGGDGIKVYTRKEYTPEHEAKLEAQRDKRAAKRVEAYKAMEAKMIPARWKQCGFAEDGVGYLHTGNTYSNMGTLKRGGGRWCDALRGYIAPCKIECDGVRIVEVSAENLCNTYGWIDFDKACELRHALTE